MSLLLEKNALVDAENIQGGTALLLAAKNGHASIVNALLAKGANPNLQAKNGLSPLTIAAAKDYTDIVNKTGHLLPLVWHLRKSHVSDSRGFVSHYVPKNSVLGNSDTHVNSSYFGPTPSAVVVIDGLFMSFKMAA